MNDTTVTLVGNVATAVEYRDTAAGGVARFRFAVSARRWDREKGLWSDGPTSFYTVSAWRSLGANLAASVSVGEPLVVHGRLRVREDEKDGQRKTFVDVAALAVGHDLSRGTAAFRRAARTEPRPEFRSDPRSEPWSEPGSEPGSERVSGAGGGRGTLRDGVLDAGPELGPAPERDPWAVAAADADTEGATRLVTVP